jgi:hypothetical protein
MNAMNKSSKTSLVIALVVVVVLFLFFGGGAMTGSMLGGMMGQGGIGGYRMGHGWINGGFSWMWIPTLLTLGIGHPAWLDDLREEVTGLDGPKPIVVVSIG